ncbi:MAG: MBL fold metallo-hydrolase [Ignavibacteria bacterium]|nr:MBL fold metallo-hydrolase [Ignavibacteria bacterium]
MRKWISKNGYELYKVLGLRCNTFLLTCKNGNILIDTGRKNRRKKLFKNIESVNLKKPGIDFLILTHSHFDHCENAAYLQLQKGCKIILSEKEKDYAIHGTLLAPGNMKFLADTAAVLFKNFGQYESFIPDIMIREDTDLKQHGFDVEIIETPGHSPGSVSVIINNEIAIAGDTLYGVFPLNVCPLLRDDMNQLINSWKKLLDTGCELYLPAHGFSIKRKLLQQQYDKYCSKNNH